MAVQSIPVSGKKHSAICALLLLVPFLAMPVQAQGQACVTNYDANTNYFPASTQTTGKQQKDSFVNTLP